MTRAYNTATTQQNSGGAVSGFAAGKNKIINGDFGIWQRGTSTTTNYGFVSDRWQYYNATTGGVTTISQQIFTPGNTITGYEPTYYLRVNQTTAGTGSASNSIFTNLEDVRLLAGQTATVSFWAKAASGTSSITPQVNQFFGTGGSATVVTNFTAIPITTSWARYSQTISIPSISGKTIGTSSYITLALQMPFNVTQTIDFWGVQLEAGSVATAFQTATGTIQGELAACQRYYFRFTADNNGTLINASYASTSVYAAGQLQFPVPMRTVPTSLDTNTLKWSNYAGTTYNMTSVAFNQASAFACQVYGTVSGVTAGQVGPILGQGTNSYVGLSAEL